MSSQRRVTQLLNHLLPNATASKLTSMLTFVLITGANRGIGYGLTEYFLRNRANYFVIATCRNPNKASKLQSLISAYPGRSALVSLDVSSEKSIINSVKNVQKITDKLHILINNAAIANKAHPIETVLGFDASEMKQILSVNVLGPALMFREYHPLLARASTREKPSKVINVSSSLGSIECYKDPNATTTTSYRVSKAALDMLTRAQSMQNGKKDGIICMALHPGHVQTDMGTSYGKRNAPVTTNDSCHGIVNLIEKMNMETHGGMLYDWKHNKLPW